MPFPLVLAWIACAAFVVPPERDVRSELERLAHPSSAARAAAGRWLGAHLAYEDRAALERTIQIGDAEVRGRLVEVLGGEDRLAYLAALLGGADDPELARVGRAALASGLQRWSPSAQEPGLTRSDLHEAMSAWIGPRIHVDVTLATAPLDDVLDLVVPVAPRGVDIAVAPGLGRPASALPRAAIQGSFESVLLELAERHDARIVGFACGEENADSGRWLLLAPRLQRDDDPQASAAQRLAQWALDVVGPGDPEARVASARALAASGWPAGVDLLAQHAVRAHDAAALEGVLLAARRGRIAPVLLKSETQVALRAEIERALSDVEGGGRRAIRLARALGATGTRGPAGEDLVAPALAGLATLGGRALWTRLVELEARQPTGPDARAALDLVLARDDVEAASRFLALAIRARFPEPVDGPARLSELVQHAAPLGRLADLARFLRDARAYPPESWRDPLHLDLSWTVAMRAYVATAWLARGELEPALAHVANLLVEEDVLVRERLAVALGEFTLDTPPLLRDAFFARLQDTPLVARATAARFVALTVGALSEDHAAAVLASIPKPAATREDMALLGALATSTRGAEARERLVAAVVPDVDVDDLVHGLDRAIEAIRAARDPELEREFTRAVRPGNAGTSLRLRSRLTVGRWPSPAPGRVAELGREDRGFERLGP